MSETSKCNRCGAPLLPDSPEGLCPRCLIALNLATQTEIPGETGAAKPPPTPPLPVADVAKLFPQLEILECLGRGGMGAVYKARQPRLDRLIALKILSPEKQGNQKFADRFEREARALARLHHPNIVAVYDFGEVQGNFYLLMEFVDGLTLRQLLQARKLSPSEALAIVPKICEALQYAHEQGIVHRDIKPENILMDKQGQIKIADFGIAKILGDGGRTNLTEEQAIGTPHYMSPEQIEKPQSVDHRADIYSLGVVFYEMLTGELPLGKFQPPSKKVHIDVRLDEIVLRALEKEPERRYQRASEVKTHVETVAATSEPREARSDEAQTRKSGLVRIVEIFFDITFKSRLAIRLLNFSALGFLSFLGFLGYLPGMQRCFGFFGFAGFFGLIGVAFIVELLSRGKTGPQGTFRAAVKYSLPIIVIVVLGIIFGVWSLLHMRPASPDVRELRKVTIIGLYRPDSPELPKWAAQFWVDHPTNGNDFVIAIKEWIPSMTNQMRVFQRHCPRDFLLTASQHPQISVHLTSLDMSSGDGSFQAFGAQIDPEDKDKLVPDIAYSIQPINTSDTYQWTVAPDVSIVPEPLTPSESVDGSILASQPPVVVETFPLSGARDVEPGETYISVRFSKDMMDNFWSWSTAWKNSTPDFLSSPHYEADSRTCAVKVKLEPGRTYAFWLNSDKFHNFKDKEGRSAVPYLLIFRTKESSVANASDTLTSTNHAQVISVSPPDGATDVDPLQTIRIRFDQPMNPNDINIMWYSGGFLSNGQIQYEPARNEFAIPVQLLSGKTNKLMIAAAGEGFRSANAMPADEFSWQFTTKPFVPKPGASKPVVVKILPATGKTMSVLTMLQISFDQPMTFDYGFPYLRDRGMMSSDLPGIVPAFSYDWYTRRMTIPLILPPDNETKLTLEGFYNTDGVTSAPVIVRCEIGTNNYSDEQLQSISTAAKNPKLEQLLSSMKAARAELNSGVETVKRISMGQEKGAFTGIATDSATFKWQGTNQFYEDISEIMNSEAFVLGSDGAVCWLYGDDSYNGPRLNSSPVPSVADIYVSIADPFGLTRQTVQSAIAKEKLVYEEQTRLDGHLCYHITSWNVEQTGNEYWPVSVAKTEWWIDSETYLPLQVVQYAPGQQMFKFSYQALNQPLPAAAFQPPAGEGVKSSDWFGKKLGPNEKRFFIIKDASNGEMSGKFGRQGPNGSTDAGLN